MGLSIELEPGGYVVIRAEGSVSVDDVGAVIRRLQEPDLAGRDVLAEVRPGVKPQLSTEDLQQASSLASSLGPRGLQGRVAVLVEAGGLAYGLARMYQAMREADSGFAKQIRVFDSRREALAFLASDDPAT